MSALMGSVSALVGTRLCSSVPVFELSSSRPQPAQRTSHGVCQANNNKFPEDAQTDTSRRSVLLVGASVAAAAAAFLSQPGAQAKRKPPPSPEPKKFEDDKNLSGVDAKKMANARRKEAMKAMLETAKAKSKEVVEAVKPPTSISIRTSS